MMLNDEYAVTIKDDILLMISDTLQADQINDACKTCSTPDIDDSKETAYLCHLLGDPDETRNIAFDLRQIVQTMELHPSGMISDSLGKQKGGMKADDVCKVEKELRKSEYL